MSNYSQHQLQALRLVETQAKQKQLLQQNKDAATSHLLKIQQLLAQKPLPR